MATEYRSGCPISLTQELLGDRWTLLILRGIVSADRRHFRELLRGSKEGLTSSILADRLDRLLDAGILTRRADPTHKQKVIYTLTAAGIDLVPVLARIGIWGATLCHAHPDLAAAAHDLDYAMPDTWVSLMSTLRTTHDPA